MRIAILDAQDSPRIGTAIARGLEGRGHTTVVHRLAEERFAPCQGCFGCWVEHPGSCKVRDAGNIVMRDIMGADRLVWLVRPRFACWDPLSKAALDRTIGLLSPFFRRVEGETHHHRRYAAYPAWHVVAVSEGPPSTDERTDFERLVARNALNMHARVAPPVWVAEAASDAELASVAERIGQSNLGVTLRPEIPPPYRPRHLTPRGVPAASGAEERRAVLWVGSAKPSGTSTSEAFGRALLRRLEARGWECDTLHLARAVRLGRGERVEAGESVAGADLLVLASPIYIDCLPAVVLAAVHALVRELVHAGEGAAAHRPALLPIVQCGFPETSHTTLALEILERAAESAGMAWAGHLYAGEGGAVDGRDVDASPRLRGKALALDQAADDLHRGQPVSDAATAAFAQPIMPEGLYRAAGQVGWVVAAARAGALFRLRDRPFAATE